MWYRLRKYFGFSRRELNGISVLLVLMLFVWLLPPIYGYLDKPDPIVFERLVADEKLMHTSPSYFSFNPNGLSETDWISLGLTSQQIKNIKNYERKGGRFYKKEDFKKLYTISATDYERLAPFIVIPQEQKERKQFNKSIQPLDTIHVSKPRQSMVERSSRPAKSILVIDLNVADSAALTELPGIGPVFASRIIRYRKLLGGFYKTAQLLEVYGMDSVRYQAFLPHIQLVEPTVAMLNLNTATIEQLGKHPYIGFKYAKRIVGYRLQHGHFKQLEDLLQIVLIDEDYLRKIAPYLTLHDD
ncbi:helix-hairpin-helix domain-containing protein [Olivibacter ginsenosidimutans]|uniref:Helix-hairpin-helix domain-containing protein n=1 Tax=Olivibacter ginsenosidimutans TaxID=1176537 RepID=A0ABP9AHZ9_9SPHI